MSTTELATLQAFLLYLLSVCQSVNPISLFCLIGIAVRVATRLGIHRDGDQPTPTTLVATGYVDKRIAELTGSAITALSSSRTDCRLPLNINDSDLHKHTKAPPVPFAGSTEMLFCLPRVELLVSATPSGLRPDPSIVRNRQNNEPLVPPSNFSPLEVNESPFSDLNEYSAYIESTYLRYCDPEIPIQNFTLLTARESLYKLRVVEFMCRGIPTTKLSDEERNDLFMTSVQMIECDDEIYTTEELRGFLWYTQFQAPMPGMSELRHRTTGPLCERAWKAIFNNHGHRGLVRNLKSPMHTAFGQAILKAWDAHEQAEIQQGRDIESPELITVLRRVYVSKMKYSEGKHGSARDSNAAPAPRADHVGSTTEMSSSGNINTEPGMEFQQSGTDFDTSMMFPSLDSGSQMYGLGMIAYEEPNWSYLMQSGSLGDY
ncbi:fungal-specific transcription factor domain-containing protein [Penicillium sp. IBT 16267x]|nr:fungal-specific transcription factor domain-containing protein [Penicillium sp. IBT 16267x]